MIPASSFSGHCSLPSTSLFLLFRGVFVSVEFFTFFDFASGSFALDFLFVDRVVEVDGIFLGPLSYPSTACTVSFSFSMETAVFLFDISCFSVCDFEPAENIQRAPRTGSFSVMQLTIMILLPFPTLSFVHPTVPYSLIERCGFSKAFKSTHSFFTL